ncbi:hypothetical protein [Gaoshiqia sp. Z1-71]|uniref:hypothetical protein n=1 Tax=Gaoshiqia hydrogeniformans TaxID=3290090 RepID=UPI003BF927B7
MKFVIIQCVKAYHEELNKILNSIQINAYSEFNVEGFMKNVESESDLNNWFASTKNPYSYMVSFTFLAADKADELLKRIEQFNQTVEDISPINAYIVGVEKFV